MGSFTKGLNRDTAGQDQPKGTWSYAKNALVKRDIGGISNEKGTGTAVPLNQGYTIVGIIEIDTNTTIIFSKCDGCGSQIHIGESEIGIFDHTTAENTIGINAQTGDTAFGYRAIYHPDPAHEVAGYTDATSDIFFRGIETRLNFSTHHPVSGTYRYNSEGDLIIYFTDNFNPPRYMNVTKQRANINILDGTNIEKLYGIMPNQSNWWQNEMLSLSPSTGNIPKIKAFEILFGGRLKTGSYTLFVAYEDDKRTRTNYVAMSMPVFITDEPISRNNPYANDGAVDNITSGKSIKWNITDSNLEYTYLKCLVIERHVESEIAYELDPIEIAASGSLISVIFTGNETASISSPQEAVKDHIHYTTAKSLEILESTQYMANLGSTPTLDYQKYANFIKLWPVIENVPDFDLLAPLIDDNGLNDRDEIEIYNFNQLSNSYRNPQWASLKQGYMRDEIYAFYISFIKKDGSMTPAYHIPGREDISTELQQYKWPTSPTDEYYGGDSRPQDISSDFQKFEFRDYSTHSSNPTGMNYWENKDEYYPNTDDWDVVDANNPGVIVDTLRGKNVRHHHFPRNTEDDGSLTPWKSIHTWLDATTTPGYYSYETYTGKFWWSSSDCQGSTSDPNEVRIAPINQNNPDCHFVQQELGSTGNWYQLCGSSTTQTGTPPNRVYNGATSIVTDQGTVLQTSDVVGQSITFKLVGQSSGPASITRNITGVTSFMSNKIFQIDGNGLSSWGVCGCCGPVSGVLGWDQFGNKQGSYAMGNWEIVEATWNGSVTTIHGWRQEINILGFKLTDVKVPFDMAQDLQGFRIYRAKRRQSQKTILGQSVMHPMILARGYRYSSYNDKQSTWCKVPCRAETFENGNAFGTNFTSYGNVLTSDEPFYNIVDDAATQLGSYHGVSFHAFEMLKHQSSLVPATHFHMQYDLQFDVHDSTNHLWKNYESTITGNWSININVTPFYNVSAGIFLMGLDYQNTAGGPNGPNQHPHFITEGAKAYCPSRAIYKPEGNFGADYVHNVGGETSAIFKLANPARLLGNAVTDAAYGTTVDTSTGGTASAFKNFIGDFPSEETYLTIANLKSVKRNVYNSFDAQDLEWTGYEVIGDDFQRFVCANGASFGNLFGSTPVFETEMIYGGDIFLTRSAHRSTWDSNSDAWASNGIAEWSKSCSYRALYSIIVESTDNINYRHSTGVGTAFFPLYSPKNLLFSLEGACLNSIDYRVTTQEDIAYCPNSSGAADVNLSDTFMGVEHYDADGPTSIPFDSCSILDLTAPIGSTHPGNVSQALTVAVGVPEGIMYNTSYSHKMDIKTPIPLPKVFTDYTKFPTRIIRSLPDNGIEDGLRLFYPEAYIDLDKSKGDINSIFSLDNLLYIHAEDTLLKTKGKQKMQTSEGVADIGSGDIFAQSPEEVIQTTKGYAGSAHMSTGKVTSFGYIWLDYRSRNVFRMTDKIEAISDFGLGKWFQDNIPHALEEFGMNQSPEAHTSGIGFHAAIDHVYNRYILTKKEPVPTASFIALHEFDIKDAVNNSIVWFEDERAFKGYTAFNNSWEIIQWDNTLYFTPNDWTVSFQLDANIWVSYHDYTPNLFITTRKGLFGASFNLATLDQGLTTNTTNLYEHDVMFAGTNTYTSFYDRANSHWFHFEYVSNREPNLDKGFFNFTYDITVQVANIWSSAMFNSTNTAPKPPDHSTGFTSFFVYNQTQMSEMVTLQNLVNCRKVGGSWKVNSFRDMVQLNLDTSNPSFGAATPLPSLTVPGTWVPLTNQPMLLGNGMNLSPNASYLNTGIPWNEQKRFSGKYLNIHLISDNSENNLLTLHETAVGAKPYMR